MNRMQRQVEEFHRAFEHPIGVTPGFSRPELRAELIKEEARETIEAIERGDLTEAVDGLCDLLYVTLGAAVEFGIDIEPIFDEVHRANMAKVGGETRADGKQMKPKNWTAPDIRGALHAQGWKP